MERKAGPGLIRRTLSGLWRALDRIRQASLNLIFLAVLAFLVAGWLASRPAALPADAALLIAPRGQLVEQRSVKTPMSLLQGGDGMHQVLLRDVVDAIRGAASDSRIKALVIETDSLSGAGLAKLEEIAEALDAFRKTGKRFTPGVATSTRPSTTWRPTPTRSSSTPTATCCSPASRATPPTSRACSTRPA